VFAFAAGVRTAPSSYTPPLLSVCLSLSVSLWSLCLSLCLCLSLSLSRSLCPAPDDAVCIACRCSRFLTPPHPTLSTLSKTALRHCIAHILAPGGRIFWLQR
jgi:hypothetical protein